MECERLRFARHAIERMFQRAVPPDLIRKIIQSGETIASYPDDMPYPSVLILGFERDQPIHVVVARDERTGYCHVITLYRPDPGIWHADFKTRRRP